MDASTENGSATRVVLAHGNPAVREALRAFTVQGLGMQVVGEAGDAATLRGNIAAERPDLVILAWKLVAADAQATLRELRGRCEDGRFVVLGPRPDVRQAALAAGADAFISMMDAPDVVAGTLLLASSAGASNDSSTTQRRSGTAGGEKTHEPGGLS